MKIRIMVMAVVMLSLSYKCFAIPISNSEITASSTLTPINFGGAIGVLSVDKILDGVTSDAYPWNGFATNNNTGTIRLDFANLYDLESFTIWNDINVGGQGVKDFRLDFYDENDNQIIPGFSTQFVAPFNQVAEREYVFDNLISGVSWVNMVVLSSYPSFNRIEIREVAFDGFLSAVGVPAPASIWLLLLGLVVLQYRGRT